VYDFLLLLVQGSSAQTNTLTSVKQLHLVTARWLHRSTSVSSTSHIIISWCLSERDVEVFFCFVHHLAAAAAIAIHCYQTYAWAGLHAGYTGPRNQLSSSQTGQAKRKNELAELIGGCIQSSKFSNTPVGQRHILIEHVVIWMVSYMMLDHTVS